MAREAPDLNSSRKVISTTLSSQSSPYMSAFLPLSSTSPAVASQRLQPASDLTSQATTPSTNLETRTSTSSPTPALTRTTATIPSHSHAFPTSNETMGRTMPDIPLPISYTPTTHRISKAKKGKRVHQCEYQGCNKVFTRAEHRRRHELNHTPEASFSCTYEGCRKGFRRHDLLARHMERHDMETQSDASATRQWRHSKSSIPSAPPGLVSPIPVDANRGSFPVSSQPTTSISTGTMIGTGIQPDLAGDLSLSWGGMEIPMQPQAQMFGSHIRDSTDDLPFYSSPETCASPSSDGTSSFPMSGPRHSSTPTAAVLERYTSNVFTPDLSASPLQMPATPLQVPVTTRDWDPLDSISGPNLGSFSMDHRNLLQPVESAVPIPLSNLDGDEWFTLRRELTAAPGVMSGNDGMEIVDTIKWQDCFEYYWLHFHPLFPIVHRPTFFATKPSPLMAGAMLAIGSQFDTRPNAKEYSLALLEACLKLLSKRPQITSRSRITDIQTIFLLEFLSKFRSRRADVHVSHRFRSLYGSFMQDRHWISQNPLAVSNTLPSNPNQKALANAQKFWVEHETRRRVLQASFILDAQMSAFFDHPPVFLQPNSGAVDIPFPCSSNLWEGRQLHDWFNLAKASVSTSLESIAMNLGGSAAIKADDLDTFQSTLLLAYKLSSRTPNRDLESALGSFANMLTHNGPVTPQAPLFSRHSRTVLTYHALLAAHYTPLRDLLTVSGESWVFNQKLPEEANFREAKRRLRSWVSDTDNVRKAVWHSIRVLQYAVSEIPTTASRQLALPEYISRAVGTDHMVDVEKPTYEQPPQEPEPTSILNSWSTSLFPGARISDPGFSFPLELESNPLMMLHTNWSLYISALICWAYGFEPSHVLPLPSLLSPHPHHPYHQASSSSNSSDDGSVIESAHSYLSAMLSLAPTWEHISQTNIPTSVRCNALPLLEFIRTTRLKDGRMGGLLNEGERVLTRLCETRGMWSF